MARESKSAAKTATKKKATATRKASSTTAQVPRGARLPAAALTLRDDLMMARLAEGWTWEAVAREAGISVSGAKKAVAVRRAAAPMKLRHDPVKIVETAMEGFVRSVSSFELMALEAASERNWAAAVGAKKGANDARGKILALLQATGRLPQELSALRHLIDLRAIAVRMIDALDGFERAMAQLNIEEETRAAIDAGVAEVRGTFNELIGIEEEPVEGTARELPA